MMTPEEKKELELLRSMENPEGDYLMGAVETLGNSMALGLGDEIGAGFNALTGMAQEGESFGDAYSRLLAESQARTGQFAEENPLTSMALKVAPAVGTGIASAPKLLGQAPSLMRTTGVGLGEAGYYGAAEAEQGNRLQGAVEALPYGFIAPGAQVAGDIYRGMRGNKASTAAQLLNDSIEATGMSRAEIASGLGDEASLADINPLLKQHAMGVAHRTPVTRQAAQAIEERGQRMTSRVLNSIRAASDDTRRFSQSQRDMRSIQSAKARPLYQKAYEAEIPVTPELESILNTPSGQKAFKAAQQIAGDEKRVLPEIVDLEGNMVRVPDMQAWDDIKRGFDDVIEANTEFGRANSKARRALMMKNEMLGILDDLNPAYKQARDVWSSDQSVINAMNNGKRALNRSLDEVIEDTKTLSYAEREAMVKGFIDDIVDKVGKRADNTIGGFNFLNNNNARQKIMAILGDTPDKAAIADNIIDSVARERNFARTNIDVLGGSQTEIRKQAAKMQDMGRGGVGDITSVPGAVREAKKLLRKSSGLSDADANELATVIFDTNMTPEKLDIVLKDYKLSKSVIDGLRSLSLGATAGGAASNE